MSGEKRWFGVSLGDYEEHEYFVESASKAKWQCYLSARDAGLFGGRHGFQDFLHRGVSVRSLGDIGDPRTPEYGAAP